MKLSHPAGCGKLDTRVSACNAPLNTVCPTDGLLRLLLLFVVTIVGKMSRKIQRHNPQLRPAALRVDPGNVLVLLRSRLQLYLSADILIHLDVVLLIVVIAGQPLGSTRRRAYRVAVPALDHVPIPPQRLPVERCHLVRSVRRRIARRLHPQLKPPETEVHIRRAVVLVFFFNQHCPRIHRQPQPLLHGRIVGLHRHSAKWRRDLHVLVIAVLVVLYPAPARQHRRQNRHRRHCNSLRPHRRPSRSLPQHSTPQPRLRFHCPTPADFHSNPEINLKPVACFSKAE